MFDGDGARLRLVSEARRIRSAHLFDPYLAIHTSRFEPLPNQIISVCGEILSCQPMRFLLGDDAGAGKTIMAHGKPHLRETHRIETLKLSLVKERSALSYTLSIPLQAAQTTRELAGSDLDRETFGILLLDARHQVTALHVISVGSLNGSIVHPHEVFKAAILGNAAALILFHNHPSGDLTPSAKDRAITKRLTGAGKHLGISVLYHLILGDRGDYGNFQEEGWNLAR